MKYDPMFFAITPVLMPSLMVAPFIVALAWNPFARAMILSYLAVKNKE